MSEKSALEHNTPSTSREILGISQPGEAERPKDDVDALDELIEEFIEQMKIRFTTSQIWRCHALRPAAILRLKSEVFYKEDGKTQQRICYKGKINSSSPVDYMPIFFVVTCGRILHCDQTHKYTFIAIAENDTDRVLCRLDLKEHEEEKEMEVTMAVDDVTESVSILLKALDQQKNNIEDKLTQVYSYKEPVDLLNLLVRVEGKLTFIKEKELIILVNRCVIIDEEEHKAFLNMCAICDRHESRIIFQQQNSRRYGKV